MCAPKRDLFKKTRESLKNEGLTATAKKSIRYLRYLSSLPPSPKWTRAFDIEQGDTVIDIGACIGSFTIMAAKITGNEGFVLAIEPAPSNLRELKSNVERYPNVEIVEGAIMNKQGQDKLYLNPASREGHSMIESIVGAGQRARGENIYANEQILVNVFTVDRLCADRNITQVDFIKIDIEGGELLALQGAGNVLNNTKKIVVEAYHPTPGTVTSQNPMGEPTAQKVREILDSYGFHTYVSSDNWVWGWANSIHPNTAFVS